MCQHTTEFRSKGWEWNKLSKPISTLGSFMKYINSRSCCHSERGQRPDEEADPSSPERSMALPRMKSRRRATAHRADHMAAWPATTGTAPHTRLRWLKPRRPDCGLQVLSCKGVADASSNLRSQVHTLLKMQFLDLLMGPLSWSWPS